MKRPFILLLLLLLLGHVRGQEPASRRGSDSVRIYFRAGESFPDLSFRGNGDRMDAFTLRLETLLSDPSCRLLGVRMVSGASPEGNTALNKTLSEERASRFRRYLNGRFTGRDIPVISHAPGIDWERLLLLTEADPDVPHRTQALDILRHTPEWITRDGAVVDGRKHRLAMLGGGSTWRYMESHLFPELRSSVLQLRYECAYPGTDTVRVTRTDTVVSVRIDTVSVVRVDTVALPGARKPFYLGLSTNLLYDALLVPNIGLEVYLGRGWSVAADWMYAWWKSDRRHRYHRIYGGELELRRRFGSKPGRSPLTGHHLGVYGQVLTYDLEWGGEGYLGDRWSYGGGVSYGYSAPIGRRLNIDFMLGIGYLGGEYFEYVPQDGCYLWRATRQRHWFGPTKAAVSLVWLIGRGNHNEKKGGVQ
ncbi:putative exported transmembrane protein [Bacteroides heparinolyticus]|uniref:Putative exported transmembrane protein n=1 Tax=Prevotella heparinolytica TaxID=28113 RepID=A0A449I4N8_9BACE|nr:DUF3575 domain-containing protein [Bacteroides heparinolyticus]VFB14418.1 putative exported transmembrane protein [Bacteroides heparinolyticus]